MKSTKRTLLLATVLVAAGSAQAETARDFLRTFEAGARKTDAGYAPLAPRGERFFKTVHGNDWSCATCHGENPAVPGRHAKTGKPIDPLAPVANAERFARGEKVDKWFKRNCNDVLGRACTEAEKGDVLAWLITVNK